MQPFVHLHVHSQYSVLDGQASIAAIVDKAIDDGMPAIALTDHGNMFGVKEFYNYIKKKNGKIGFVLLVNNIVKGAAGGSIQNAEAFVTRFGLR